MQYSIAVTIMAIVLSPAISAAQQTTGAGSAPAPTATSTPVSPFAIPVNRNIGYRCESQQNFNLQWWFTGSLVISADPTGKITGGYLGDSDQDNPSYPPDPMLGREEPVTGSITPSNKINLVIGTAPTQWNIQGTATAREINGNFSTGRFGLMTFYATRVHIPKHPANIQRSNP